MRLEICVSRTSVIEIGKEVQRGLVGFLTAEGVEGREVHRPLSAVCGVHRMSSSRVLERHRRFHEGPLSLQDDSQHPP